MSADIVAVYVHQASSQEIKDDALTQEALSRLKAAFPGAALYSNYALGEMTLLKGELIDNLGEILPPGQGNEEDSLAFFTGFAPLLDQELSAEVQSQHLKYLAHYTYSENIPRGFVPDFLTREFLSLLGDNRPLDLRDFVFKNINKYDVEIFYKAPDLRQFRLDLSTSTARSRRMALELLEETLDVAYGDMSALLLKSPEIMRPFPSYIELEPTLRSPVQPVFTLPTSGQETELSPELLEKLFSEIEASPLAGDLTVSLGGRGEPLLHPAINDVIARLAASSRVQLIYLETWGLDLSPERVAELSALPGIEKLNVIFRLTTLSPERYLELHGADILPDILKNLEALEKAPPPFALYAEMLKIKDVEDEITEYFDRFEESPINVILQKFNSYVGRLPERRVSNLTPLHRDFCWHLARDVYINAAGQMPLCKQDPATEGDFQLDFQKNSILDFLKQTQEFHGASVRGEHDKIPAPCVNCDEWYTFNG